MNTNTFWIKHASFWNSPGRRGIPGRLFLVEVSPRALSLTVGHIAPLTAPSHSTHASSESKTWEQKEKTPYINMPVHKSIQCIVSPYRPILTLSHTHTHYKNSWLVCPRPSERSAVNALTRLSGPLWMPSPGCECPSKISLWVSCLTLFKLRYHSQVSMLVPWPVNLFQRWPQCTTAIVVP